MKLVKLVFEVKEFSNFVRDISVLTIHTKEELQKEVYKILAQSPLLQEQVRRSLYVEVVKDILDILIYKGMIAYPAGLPTETYEIFI